MPNENLSTSQLGRTVTNLYNNSTLPYPGFETVSFQTAGQLTRVRNSHNTPGYGQRKLTGDLPENHFGFAEVWFTALQGMSFQKTINTPTKWTVSSTRGRIGPLWNLPVPWSGAYLTALRLNQSNEVRAKLARKVLDSEIDLSVTAGEFRETAHLFVELARRLSQAIAAARRGDAAGVKKALSLNGSRDWANLWLMINYGIRPLIMDIQGGIKAIEKGIMKEVYHVERASVLYEDTKLVTTGSLENGLYITSWTLKLQTGCRVKYIVTDGQLATLASVGLLNPLSLAWELKKLSFVIDWAVGVGAWLGQLSASAGKSFSGGSETVFTRITGHTQYSRVGGGSTIHNSHGVSMYSNVAVQRTGLVTWPVASLPAIRDPISLFNLTTGIALLRQSKF